MNDADGLGYSQPEKDALVSFGAEPHQVIPLMWAERMLTMWRRRDPAHFGALLAEVATGTAPKARRRNDEDG